MKNVLKKSLQTMTKESPVTDDVSDMKRPHESTALEVRSETDTLDNSFVPQRRKDQRPGSVGEDNVHEVEESGVNLETGGCPKKL